VSAKYLRESGLTEADEKSECWQADSRTSNNEAMNGKQSGLFSADLSPHAELASASLTGGVQAADRAPALPQSDRLRASERPDGNLHSFARQMADFSWVDSTFREARAVCAIGMLPIGHECSAISRQTIACGIPESSY
jgi:hypothetical protein